MKLKIGHAAHATDVLAGFPFEKDQFIEEETENLILVNLADATDTTAAQEQFLNTSYDVLEYEIV